ncbi:MAG: alpha/beta hydrolase [Sphingomonadales bacterium]|nr:alpha/beta hydrolase [Sphingomonadaceae bacterium]MBS3931548.1 alpha/beta hydrolase [Sphingomonadales bacterium]
MIARRTLLGNLAVLAAMGAVQPASAAPALARDAEEIPLWPGQPPGRGGPKGPEKLGDKGAALGALSNISAPRMRVYRPANANGAAVVVCGGGGYFRIQLQKESTPIALWLQQRGFTVFELLYRLPGDGWEASAPFMDAQRAMRIVRSRAAEFGIDPKQIGIMGFSAGGHLAGFTALQPQRKLYAGADAFEKTSARPDFAVLLFPVVSLRKPYDKTRTRREIVGETPSEAAQEAWSLDTHASAAAPPTIIFASADDPITPPGHGILLFEKLNAAGASAELHLFRNGGHGWGLGRPEQELSQWPQMFTQWFQSIKTQQSKQGV